MYNKKQAIELLKKDPRVQKVVTSANRLTIYTNPIIPVSDKHSSLFIYPIGTYCIKINTVTRTLSSGEKVFYKLDMCIKHEQLASYQKRIHYHVSSNWGEFICWGTAEEEVEIISKNKDWFWYTKRALDLLEDGNPEGDEYEAFYEVNTKAMDAYARSKDDKKMVEKIKELRFKKLRKYGFCKGE